MATNLKVTHNAHEESLAFVASQNRVTGFDVKGNNMDSYGHERDESIMNVENARLVTGQKDSFNTVDETHNDLQKGPNKKYIDIQNSSATKTNGTTTTMADSFDDMDFNASSNITVAKGNDYDSFFAEDNQNQTQDNQNETQDNQHEKEKQMNFENENKMTNYENYNNYDNTKKINNDVVFDNNKNENAQQEKDTPTFLSVWQEQRRQQLEKKIQTEKSEMKTNEDNGKREIEDFLNKRKQKITQTKKDNKIREKDISADINSVFQHGTIWQQVCKLVDLNRNDESINRMKDLLITLKNEDAKSKK